MNDAEFQNRLRSLGSAQFREDFDTAICDLYKEATTAQRALLRDGIRAGTPRRPTTWRYPTDYFQSHLSREQRYRQMLIRMSFNDGSDDYREDLLAMARCYHNLALLGVDADAVLEELAQMSSPTFARLVLGFVRRAPDQKSMKAFGLKVVQTDQGPIADTSL